MEPKFQTSFIPKQSLAPQQTAARRSVGRTSFALGTVIGTVIFILAVSASVLLFLYQQYLGSSIKSNQASLSKAREAFEPALVQELTRLDHRIDAANQILDQHLAPSALFGLIQTIALQNVQFNSFSYQNSSTAQGLIRIALSGKAKSFKTMALQSDLVGTHPQLQNAVVSNLALNSNGEVSFDLVADVDARLISYQGVVDAINAPQNAPTGTSVPAATTTKSSSTAI